MGKNNNKMQKQELKLPKETSRKLQGMQSVRVTFKLPKKTIGIISIVATQLGIHQKSLFDHLMEDIDILASIADNMILTKISQKERFPKTYVISRKSLFCLEKISKSKNTHRDILIEHSVKRLLPVIEKEQEKHEKRKKIVDKFNKYLKQGVEMLNKAGEILDEDDFVYDRIRAAINVNKNACQHMNECMKRGQILEDYIVPKK